jgi:hypothetical protein
MGVPLQLVLAVQVGRKSAEILQHAPYTMATQQNSCTAAGCVAACCTHIYVCAEGCSASHVKHVLLCCRCVSDGERGCLHAGASSRAAQEQQQFHVSNVQCMKHYNPARAAQYRAAVSTGGLM